MTLSKLSQRNARRQTKDYLVYFITIILSAALIYAFNGLVFSSEILYLSANMAAMPFVIVAASLVVVGIIGWLVAYITRFMLQKRSKELGTYILLGLENKQVAKLFFMENLIVGAAALVAGILAGGLLYQGLRAMVLNAFGVPYTFGLGLSLPAVGLTFLYFVLIYLSALHKSKKRIRSMKIYDLLYFERQNEQEAVKTGKKRRWMFAASLVCGLAGVLLLLTGVVLLGFLGAALIILFLFWFFLSFSSGVPAFFNKRPGKKYKNGNLLVFRSLSAKLTTMGVTMAVVALLFTATLVAEGMGFIFNNQFQRRVELYTSYDLFIGTPETEKGLAPYLDYINEHDIPVRDSHQYTVFQNGSSTITHYLVSEEPRFTRHEDIDALMRYSDYSALREMLGYPKAKMPENGYIIHSMEFLEKSLQAYQKPLTFNGVELNPAGVYTEHFTQYLWQGNGDRFVLVLPDSVMENAQPQTSIIGIMLNGPLREEDYNALRDLDMSNYNDNVLSKDAVRLENGTLYATIVFPLFYLALVLTMVAATILTTQLLSDSNRYKQQYALMNKLGMARKDMERALRRQFTLFYAMPVVPALVISVALLLSVSGSFDPGIVTGVLHQWALVGLALLVFFTIYLIYIVASYTSFKRSVLPR